MDRLEKALLRLDIEDFYTREADLLDQRAFEDWLALFADDLVYRMPMVRNLQHQHIDREYLEEPLSIAWIDQDKELLAARVAQIRTGVHWAEEPLSRTVHLTTNVRIAGLADMTQAPDRLQVHSKFLVQRCRNEDEEHVLIGRREDDLRRSGTGWLIASRRVLIAQTVLMTPTLSFLF